MIQNCNISRVPDGVTFPTEHDAFFRYNKDHNGNPNIRLYGADEFLLNNMEVIAVTTGLETSLQLCSQLSDIVDIYPFRSRFATA